MYPMQGFPHIAILDPRTGERVVEWGMALSARDFCEKVNDFLEANNMDDDSFQPPRQQVPKGRKRTALDMTEDEQMAAVIAESLRETDSKGLTFFLHFRFPSFSKKKFCVLCLQATPLRRERIMRSRRLSNPSPSPSPLWRESRQLSIRSPKKAHLDKPVCRFGSKVSHQSQNFLVPHIFSWIFHPSCAQMGEGLSDASSKLTRSAFCTST